ncbi:hypothetical protein ACWCOP_11320 [Maricaulaceae bacterium MS644]
MHTTISAACLVISLLLVFLGARAASIMPSEYDFAIANWLVRPSSLPFLVEDARLARIARDTLAWKLALPSGAGLVSYVASRIVYRAPHDGDPHASLTAGAFTGAFAAALMLAWPSISEWAALSPPAYAPHRPVFMAVYIAQMMAVACLARFGAGVASFALYPATQSPFARSAARRAGVAVVDLAVGAGLIFAACTATSVWGPP